MARSPRSPTSRRPRFPNSRYYRPPPHSDEGCNVNLLQRPSESSVVLPVQNDIAISAGEASSSKTTAPTPTPPTSLPATFSSFTTCSSPPASVEPPMSESSVAVHNHSSEEHSPTAGQLSSPEDMTTMSKLEEIEKRFGRTWLTFPPLSPRKVRPSSSSQPGSPEDPSTSEHSGQVSSPEDINIEAAHGVSNILPTFDSREFEEFQGPTKRRKIALRRVSSL